MPNQPQPDPVFLASVLRYDERTGDLYWTAPPSRRAKVGDIAGYVGKQGYRLVGLLGRNYLAHRLVWIMLRGEAPAMLDHIDGDKSNNRINNLRPATDAQNAANRGLRSDNTSGFKGATRHGSGFKAQATIGGTNKYIGTYRTSEEAHAAYMEVASITFGEYCNSGISHRK